MAPLVTTAWIVAQPRPDDDPDYVYPGFSFNVMGEEVPEATAAGRVIFPATGGTYDPAEYPELATALAAAGLTPGQLPDFRAAAVVATDPSVVRRTPAPAPNDLVQILCYESAARRIEREFLAPNGLRLAPPMFFGDDETPTYVLTPADEGRPQDG